MVISDRSQGGKSWDTAGLKVRGVIRQQQIPQAQVLHSTPVSGLKVVAVLITAHE